MTGALRRRLVDLAHRRHGETDLAEAALLIAAEAYPGLDIRRHLDRLDALAAEARASQSAAGSDPASQARWLTRFLYREQGFRGNAEHYYDPRNSYLNEVLERRTGIPITLAVVYIEVARRLGIPARGVGFPGHFLVKHPGAPEAIVDPFSGALLTARECEQRLETALGSGQRLTAEHLAPATPLDILVRVLRNLKRIHVEAEAWLDALAASERILLLLPDQPEELRERGLLLERLDCFDEAAADLERTLELAPEQPDAEALRAHALLLRVRADRLN
jgi:regulator of sirC expression with transglutaminase-like and TPR domain